MVSTPTRHGSLYGRIWAFYDESALSESLQQTERARRLLRANADAQLDPQMLLAATRGPDGSIVDFCYRDVNDATCRYLGATRDELIGASLLTTLPGLTGSGLLERFADCTDSGARVVVDDVRHDDPIRGAGRILEIRASKAGRGLLSLTWRDVTERSELAQRISESEQRLRLLTENIGDVVSWVDPDGTFRWISKSVQQVLGAPPEHYVGRPVRDIIASDDAANHINRLVLIGQGKPYVGRAHIVDVHGVPHWVHLFGKPFLDDGGRPDGWISTFRIIDREVAAEAEAERARVLQAAADARYRRLIHTSAIGMALLSTDGRFDEVNEALCAFFGYDAKTLCAKSWIDLAAPEFLATDARAVADLMAGRISTIRERKRYINADGQSLWGDLLLNCLRRPDGTVEHLVAQIVDVTAQVTAQQRVTELAARLQAESDRTRSELRSAAAYVASILPGDLNGVVEATSRYIPSRELGGDCFDYRWVDGDHLLVYQLDVSGKGVGAALLAVSVHNMLRSGSLGRAALLNPERILAILNGLFAMEQNADNYFTMWCGVFQPSRGLLRYANAAHPPALLIVPGRQQVSVTKLTTNGMPVGTFGDSHYRTAEVLVDPGSQLLLYSDGAFEITLPDGRLASADEFVSLCTSLVGTPDWSVDSLIEALRSRSATGTFDDDLSLVRMTFP